TKTLLEQRIEQEKDRAIAAESGLGITIYNEDVRAMSAETELRTVLERLNGSPETIGSVLYLINQAIAKVVDDAPESFNTLKEIAIWLQTHATDAVAMQNQISENTSKILKEIADRIEEINKLKLLIEQEKDRAIAAENTLNITIHNEEDRAIRVETELRHLIENIDAAVDRETERATGEEALLRELINNTKTEVTNLISQETIRATSAETVLNTKIENLKQDITNITNKIDDLADDFVHRTGDTMTGSLYVNGIISASSAIYSSDIKLKENIESINDADIENVKKIDLKSYAFKADPTHVQKYGVIAQDLEAAGLKHLVYQGEEYKSVDYTAFLILKIAQLEKEIENLKNK
ncbi:MAG: tail fiber domain-containing protein, partial [bacterium]|nr:tail fiber domain-containing protein [bacterium]